MARKPQVVYVERERNPLGRVIMGLSILLFCLIAGSIFCAGAVDAETTPILIGIGLACGAGVGIGMVIS